MRDFISGMKHPVFRDALALTRAGGREATGRYLVEDADMVMQALHPSAPSPVFAVFATPEETTRLEPLCAARSVPLFVLSGAGLITKLVGTGYATAVTAVAVVAQYVVSPLDLLNGRPDALILAGERIQDPRNVGVLIRTAEAAGCAGLLLSADSAEPFSRQAVRSTTGSILRLPIALAADFAGALTDLRERNGGSSGDRGLRVVATSARAPDLAYDADLARRPLVLVVGNETQGITEATRAAATDFVRLPMADAGASSLNVTVAAGVLVYEALRQRRSAAAAS